MVPATARRWVSLPVLEFQVFSLNESLKMQHNIDWSSIFLETFPQPGATNTDIVAATVGLMAPLSAEEIALISQSQANPFPQGDALYASYRPFDPTTWAIPKRPLPPAYVSFLRWSNGGSFFNHDRRFDPFLSCSELRQYLIGYHFPQYVPGFVPFAFDGGGNVYVIDMRRESDAGEYPIVFAKLGNLKYENSKRVGISFIEVCAGHTNP